MSKKEKRNRFFKGLSIWGPILCIALLFVDQLTKILADGLLAHADRTVDYIDLGLIGLTISYNRGIAFGGLQNSTPALKMAVIIGTMLIMIGVAVLYCTMDKRRKVVRTALVMIFSGGVGNLIDRLYYRVWDSATRNGGFRDGVRDMVDLSAFGFEICNFADFFIVIGAIVLIVGFIFFDIDAFFPVGKYKKWAKEAEEKEKQKKATKEGTVALAIDNAQDEPAPEIAPDGAPENACECAPDCVDTPAPTQEETPVQVQEETPREGEAKEEKEEI